MPMFAEVIVSNAHKEVDRVFHYAIPDRLLQKLEIGMRVSVPFGRGNKKIEGYVIGFSNEIDISFDKVKEISAISEEYPVFSNKMIMLAKWMKDKYYTTLSHCLQCIMPAGIGTKALSVKYVYLNKENPDYENIIEKTIAKEDKKSEILKLLLDNDGLAYNYIKSKFKISDSPLSTLEKHNIIRIKPFEVFRSGYRDKEILQTEKLILTHEQEMALKILKDKLDNENANKHILLHGVTGSGKTEVYLQIIDEVIKKGKQAIVLVPEISLTPQTVNRFVARFGDKVSVTHSRLSAGERFDQWRKAREGLISVMIGPRSAIFTPFDNLGIVIIDEEHEHTYKSEVTPKYDAREVAQKLIELYGCIVLLGSATPSVETYHKAELGEIKLIALDERVNKKMPNITVVDMRIELAEGNRSIFSRELYSAIKENLYNKNQTILFMNRRGHSTFISCRSCGNVLSCDACNINYTYHIYSDKLMCHYCGKEESNPKNCPICGSKQIKYFGTGTQKIQEEIKTLFPNARVLRMDMDTTTTKHSHEDILTAFADGKADILVGTQMIAKGHDFPNVSLVGIISADVALNSGDFRAGETAFQLITQVAGRAGRAEKQGEVYIQTYNPEHYSIIYAKENDYIGFFEQEISFRKSMDYPPYTYIFSILFTGENEKNIITSITMLNDIMRFYNRKGLFELLGPSPAQISKINKNYRWRLFVKSKDEEKIKSYVFYCLDKLRQRDNLSGIMVNVSLNPNTMM